MHASTPAISTHPRLSTRLTTAFAVCALVVMSAAACAGGSDQEQSGVPTIVATTEVWGDVVEAVACDGVAEVETIIPPDGDPHAFEPSLADRATMEEASLLVANGLLEEGLGDTIASVEQSGTPVLRMVDQVALISSGSDAHDGHEDARGGDGNSDPHIWFDPTRVSAALPALGESLISDAGLDATTVEGCVGRYQAELAAVDAEVAAILELVPPERRMLVTNHDSLRYFADRYDFVVVDSAVPSSSTLAETNAAHLEELAGTMLTRGIPAIFTEVGESSQDAEALASRVGDAELVTLSTNVDESGYQAMLVEIARQIAGGLAPDPDG